MHEKLLPLHAHFELLKNLDFPLSIKYSLLFLIILQGNAQRFALLALGRAWILFESRENLKPENYSEKPQNPQRPVHALLGVLP
jgi:hypothetical protein